VRVHYFKIDTRDTQLAWRRVQGFLIVEWNEDKETIQTFSLVKVKLEFYETNNL